MASEWEIRRLGDLGTVVTGRTPPGTAPKYFGTHMSFVTPTDMDGRRRVGSTARMLSQLGEEELGRVVIPHGVAVSCIGWQMGKAMLIDRPVITNQQINSLIPRPEETDDLFLYYALSARRDEIFRLGAGGSRTPILNKNGFESYTLPLPGVSEQRKIASILGSLDDKIELNRKMNETLEAMARALFKSWFVDFDPVRVKAEGRDTGLPPHLAALFPDFFEPSDLGDIPLGWSVKSLDQIGQFLNGLALQKFPPIGERSLPVIKIAQLRSGNTVGADLASADLEPAYIVHDGDILFSWSGSLECVFWAGGPGALNQHLFKVTSADYPRWLLYLAIHLHLDDFRHIAAGKATTMGHIQRHHLSDAKMAIPPANLLHEMTRILQPILESTWRRNVQSRTLGIVRDLLLPRLISGELRISDPASAT